MCTMRERMTQVQTGLSKPNPKSIAHKISKYVFQIYILVFLYMYNLYTCVLIHV